MVVDRVKVGIRVGFRRVRVRVLELELGLDIVFGFGSGFGFGRFSGCWGEPGSIQELNPQS